MAEEFTDGQKALIEKQIFDSLPCSTNKTCKEVEAMQLSFRWVIGLLATILIGLAFNILIAQGKASTLEYRLNRIDAVMGIK